MNYNKKELLPIGFSFHREFNAQQIARRLSRFLPNTFEFKCRGG
jgi:hypothetical protein